MIASKWEEEELGEQERPGSGWCLHLYRGGGTTTGVEKDGGVAVVSKAVSE